MIEFIKNKKIIILLILIIISFFWGLDFFKTIFICYNSKKYELEEDYDEKLSNYQLLLYNNERFYFYDKKNKTILDDNSKITKEVWYGHSSCDIFETEHGENLKCEETFDFFELFLYDFRKLLVVDKDGYIIHEEIEDDIDRQMGRYGFFGNYWYGNIKLSKKDSNNEVYIQLIYNSEGGSKMNAIHTDENGKLNKLYEVVDFAFYKDKYIELTNNKINFFKNGKLIETNDKYEKLYDIYDSKYFLVKDNEHIKVIDLADRVLVDFGEYKYNLDEIAIVEENGELFIREINIDRYGTRLYRFDMLGNFEYLEN